MLLYMNLRRVIKQLMKPVKAGNHWLFRDRKIVIISDSSMISIPLSQRFQQLSLLLVMGVLCWSLYSSGRFMAYQGMIAQKEMEVMRSNLENQELQQLHDGLKADMQGINQFLDDLKKTTAQTEVQKGGAKPAAAPEKQQGNSSDKSAEMLRMQMAHLRRGMEQKLLDYATRMEKTVARTGLELQPMLANRGVASLRQIAMQPVPETGVGGPFIPASFNTGDDAARIQEDGLKQRMQYVIELSKLLQRIPLGGPIASQRITSGFGMREDPFNGHMAMHQGIDFVGPYGTKVYATAAGKVTYAGRFSEYGNFIEITHGDGLTTRYGHLKEVLVKEGQRVGRGTVIGLQGNTGRSSGTHVHYEVRKNEVALNPLPFFKAGVE